MEQYVRPTIAPQEFRDAEGRVIPYGERWGMNGAPDHTYSVLTHPERFRPLHEVARALIAYLERIYDVAVSESPSHLADVPERFLDATTVVRLIPANPRCAPITIIFTDLPGITLLAGVLVVEYAPSCGCDACDQVWDSAADDLEWLVMAVIEGGLTEHVSRGPRPTVSHRLERPDGHWGRTGRADSTITPQQLAKARARLAPIDGAWAAWSPRVP
ncbi:DUF6226 family protein [Demequina sp.]|uniref:DUF6226 family protein n=1 Tax=Demequina sp. TaxID=2050685 RepID=UPI0025C626A3|nr:DUF6226 family protein [Demequina sp.]